MKIAIALLGLCLLSMACSTVAPTDLNVPGHGRIMAGMTGDEVRAVMGRDPDMVGSGFSGCHYASRFYYHPGSSTTEWVWHQGGELLVVYLESGIVSNLGYTHP